MGANTYRELVRWQLADELQRRIIAITATAEAAVQLRVGLDRGYFDQETCRLEPIENPFGTKMLFLSPE